MSTAGLLVRVPISKVESGNLAHVTENALALSLVLTSLQTLDAAHPPPSR